MRVIKAPAFVFAAILALSALGAGSAAVGATLRAGALLGLVALGELACSVLLIAWVGSLRRVRAMVVVLVSLICFVGLLLVFAVLRRYLGNAGIVLAFPATLSALGFIRRIILWGWSTKGRGPEPGR